MVVSGITVVVSDGLSDVVDGTEFISVITSVVVDSSVVWLVVASVSADVVEGFVVVIVSVFMESVEVVVSGVVIGSAVEVVSVVVRDVCPFVIPDTVNHVLGLSVVTRERIRALRVGFHLNIPRVVVGVEIRVFSVVVSASTVVDSVFSSAVVTSVLV